MGFESMREAVAQLEKDCAERGLIFSTSFVGALPVQAYGYLDGMRFYFRFRGNWANLRVGPAEQELDELYAVRVNEDKAARMAKHKAELEAGEISAEEYRMSIFLDDRPEMPQRADDEEYMPHRIVKNAGCTGPDPEDDYAGTLTPDEAYTIFRKLVDELADVPEEDQLDEHTKIWLYEGRAAANAHWEKRMERFKTGHK